jgi:hypothetical protein
LTLFLKEQLSKVQMDFGPLSTFPIPSFFISLLKDQSSQVQADFGPLSTSLFSPILKDQSSPVQTDFGRIFTTLFPPILTHPRRWSRLHLSILPNPYHKLSLIYSTKVHPSVLDPSKVLGKEVSVQVTFCQLSSQQPSQVAAATMKSSTSLSPFTTPMFS